MARGFFGMANMLARLGKTDVAKMYKDAGVIVATKGLGTPEGNVAGDIGDLYVNATGGAATTLYVKTSGTGKTGWTAK